MTCDTCGGTSRVGTLAGDAWTPCPTCTAKPAPDIVERLDRAYIVEWRTGNMVLPTDLGSEAAAEITRLRAEEKMLLQTEVDPQSGRKKTIVVPASDRPLLERWAPACEKRFAYEMTASFLMLPDRPGVPLPLKLQEQHRDAFPSDMQIGRGAGSALAAWASGGAVTQRSAADEALREATDAAEKGREAFLAWWNGPGKRKRDMLRPHLSELQETARAADARADEEDDPFIGDESRLEGDAQPPSRPLMTQVYNADGEALEETVSTVADFLARVGRMIAGTDDMAESQAIILANQPAWRDIWSGSADAGQTFLWKSYGGRP